MTGLGAEPPTDARIVDEAFQRPPLAGELRGRAMAHGVAAGGMHIVVSVLTVPIQTALLLRYLSASDAGFWFVALSITQYLALFDLGVGPTLTRFIAITRGADSRLDPASRNVQRLADLVRCARSLYLALAAALLLTAVACFALLPRIAHRPLIDTDRIAWLCFMAGSAINLFASVNFSALAGFGIVGINRFARAIAQIVGLIVMAVALHAGLGLPAAAMSWMIQNILLLFVGSWFVRKRLPSSVRAGGHVSMRLVREMVRPSLQWAGTNLGAMLILMPGAIIVSWRLGPAAVPPYAALVQLGGAFAALVLVPIGVTEPFVSEAFGANRTDDVTRLLLRNVRIVVGAAACGAAVLAVFGPTLVGMWVGQANFAGQAALYLTLFLYLCEVHHVVHASAVMATGRLIFLKPALIAGVLNVVLGVWLVRSLGIAGVVLSTVLAQLATNNWLAPYLSLRQFQIAAGAYARVIAPVILLGAIALAVALSIRSLLRLAPQLPAVAALGGGVGATLLILLPAYFVLVVTPQERRWCLGLVRRALRQPA